MANVSDPAITEAYNQVRKEGSGVNWLLLGYKDNNTIGVDGTGAGGPSELAGGLRDDACQYAYVRVQTQDDETKRTKFAFLSWAGENSSALRRGKMSVHKASVKTAIKDFAIEFHATDRAEVTDEAFLAKLRAANY